MPDPKLLWFHSTERKSVYVEAQNFVPDAEGYVAVPENLGSYIMVIPGFTYVQLKQISIMQLTREELLMKLGASSSSVTKSSFFAAKDRQIVDTARTIRTLLKISTKSVDNLVEKIGLADSNPGHLAIFKRFA